jgi:hypothetical protein
VVPRFYGGRELVEMGEEMLLVIPCHRLFAMRSARTACMTSSMRAGFEMNGTPSIPLGLGYPLRL